MRIVLIAVVVIALLVLGRALHAQTWLGAALEGIRGLGPWAPLIFVLLYIAACVLLLPGSAPTPTTARASPRGSSASSRPGCAGRAGVLTRL